MRFVSYLSETGPRVAGVHDRGYVDLHGADPQLPASLKALLAAGPAAWERARAATARGPWLTPEQAPLLAPIPDPEKIICIGLNYADHAAESGAKVPAEPVVFNKFPTAICGPDAEIVLPRLSSQVDYEAELVVIIGRTGRAIPRDQAWEYIAGYTCGHDVSARDWQLAKPGGQWLLGKTFDRFAPCGPALVTADEVDDPGQLDIRLRLNGTTMQQSNTRQLIFPINLLVSYLSGVCTLKPGDLIFTGTPPGVGMARKPAVFLKPGDVVEIDIPRVGLLRNRFVEEGATQRP